MFSCGRASSAAGRPAAPALDHTAEPPERTLVPLQGVPAAAEEHQHGKKSQQEQQWVHDDPAD
jgi:hypothetical protein